MKYRNPVIPEGINTTQTHPLKEFAFLSAAVIGAVFLLTSILFFSIDWAAEFIPFEFETSIANSISDSIETENSELDVYLQSVADKIIPQMNLPDNMQITVHYVNQDVVNAMATLGGHVFVYRGMLEKLPHENALVMLLGHEIGHVKLRHPVKALGKGVVISLLYSLILGESSDAAASAISDASMLTLLNFSREQEEDSDEEAVKVLGSYYGHVKGASSLFEVLKQQQLLTGDTPPEFLNSHPDTQNRIQHITEMLKQNHWTSDGKLTKIPDFVRQKINQDKLDSEAE